MTSQLSSAPFIYKQELLSLREKCTVTDNDSLTLLYENDSVLQNFEKNKTQDMLLADVVLCAYYHKDDPFEEVVQGLISDFERTIYSRVNAESFNVMCKRVFYQHNSIKYSIYGNGPVQFKVG